MQILEYLPLFQVQPRKIIAYPNPPPPSTRIETLDFNKANWPKLKESLNTIDWPTSFRGTSVKLYLQVAIESISEKCTMYVPPKRLNYCMICVLLQPCLYVFVKLFYLTA